jgi:hypothetical protein
MTACLVRAAACREQAEFDAIDHDRWVDEANKWLARAMDAPCKVAITIETQNTSWTRMQPSVPLEAGARASDEQPGAQAVPFVLLSRGFAGPFDGCRKNGPGVQGPDVGTAIAHRMLPTRRGISAPGASSRRTSAPIVPKPKVQRCIPLRFGFFSLLVVL